jgi:anti-anti-sigma factor
MNGSRAEIALRGDLNAERLEELRHCLRPAESADVAVLDFAEVSYIDSTALTALVLLKNRMSKNGGSAIVRITHANKTVRRILGVCRLDTVFELTD